MPLDNEKLAKMVNSTEKLMDRVDAYEKRCDAQRKDAESKVTEEEHREYGRLRRIKGGDMTAAEHKRYDLLYDKIHEAGLARQRDDSYGHPIAKQSDLAKGQQGG